MSLSRITGLVSCVLLIISFFMNYAWYPDIEKYFTAFYSEQNYYGKPGKMLSFVAGSGIVFYLINKVWTQRLNLILAALGMAFGIRTYLLFTSGYDGYVPEAEPGIYLMLAGCLGHLAGAMAALAVVKRNVSDDAFPEKVKE
ncbi:MAG: hypothetical protein MUE71_10695 [Chitinophagaceae bacterium]|jgi:hypothetical protein|nr:hypothetical protein [Chitinophagaceae bacterium]